MMIQILKTESVSYDIQETLQRAKEKSTDTRMRFFKNILKVKLGRPTMIVERSSREARVRQT